MLNKGKTGTRLESKRCSECGGSGFTYSNGFETSVDGVRGYRCMQCETIKPESCNAFCYMDPTVTCNKAANHTGYHESAPMKYGPKENGGCWQFSDKAKRK